MAANCAYTVSDFSLLVCGNGRTVSIASTPTRTDAQVALLITGQAMSDVQVRVTLTVYWSHLSYAGVNDRVPTAERCTVVLPVILQLIAID
jgi:hypothetical protein